MNARCLLLAGIVALAACGDAKRPAPGGLPLAMQSPGPTTLLRLPAKGGPVLAYRAGDLSRVDWQVTKVPPIRRIVGADMDQALVFALLTLIYIVLATAGHHDEDEEHAPHADQVPARPVPSGAAGD